MRGRQDRGVQIPGQWHLPGRGRKRKIAHLVGVARGSPLLTTIALTTAPTHLIGHSALDGHQGGVASVEAEEAFSDLQMYSVEV